MAITRQTIGRNASEIIGPVCGQGVERKCFYYYFLIYRVKDTYNME